mgnify:CR=1 FL=1
MYEYKVNALLEDLLHHLITLRVLASVPLFNACLGVSVNVCIVQKP